MLLSTQTDALGERHGDREAIRLIKEAGFDAFDFSFFRMGSKDCPMDAPDYREYARSLRAYADELGIPCNQAHAPFYSKFAFGDDDADKARYAAILRSMEAAAILGADAIVVHPIHHVPYLKHRQELKELNLRFYKSLVPYCESFGINVACENMWQHSKKQPGKIIDSVCSDEDELCEYVDAVGSEHIVVCMDVGHVVLTDRDIGHYVRTLGKKRLRALHVHDNDLVNDSHTLPFTMSIDFKELTDALKEIGYECDFTFEADNFLRRMPLELEAEALRFMEKVGRYLQHSCF